MCAACERRTRPEVKAKELPAGHPRWQAITGLIVTLVGVGVTVLFAMMDN